MPTIIYNETGDASETEMDSLETAAKDWRDGQDKVLVSLEKRFDVGAVSIHLTWDVSETGVESAVGSLDTAIQNLGVSLPLASDAADVQYGQR